MPEPYIGEIRMVGFNFPPAGWALCNGQLMPISENDALFTLIGTTYGGDGQATFALPNLQSRVPMHMGTNQGNTFQLGEAAGVEQVTLTTQQIPVHNHAFVASTNPGGNSNPQDSVIAQSVGGLQVYRVDPPANPMAPNSLSPTGGSQPHENMQPYLVINFIISLYGVFPTQT